MSDDLTLGALACIRKRPAMYVGDLDDPLTITHMLQWTLYPAIVAGHKDGAKILRLTTTEGPKMGWTVYHDTIWDLSVDVRASKVLGREMRGPEYDMTVLTAGSMHDVDPHDHLRGCGLVVVNALSQKASITVVTDSGAFGQAYTQGVPDAPWGPIERESRNVGSYLHFEPDPTIFPQRTIHDSSLLRYLREHVPDKMSALWEGQ